MGCSSKTSAPQTYRGGYKITVTDSANLPRRPHSIRDQGVRAERDAATFLGANSVESVGNPAVG
jgi:hypothetical protein